MLKAVITGDIINSTQIAPQWKGLIIESLQAVVRDFSDQTPLKIEMYRGDSFQMLIDNASYAFEIGVALRAKLRAHTPKEERLWDCRIAIGLGEINFKSTHISTSDGEAFQLSGRCFDSLGKQNLAIASPWAQLDANIALPTRFADDIITNWTAKQAKVVYHEIRSRCSQKELATLLGMTPQNLNSLWNSAKCTLILDYIKHCKTQLSHVITNNHNG